MPFIGAERSLAAPGNMAAKVSFYSSFIKMDLSRSKLDCLALSTVCTTALLLECLREGVCGIEEFRLNSSSSWNSNENVEPS